MAFTQAGMMSPPSSFGAILQRAMVVPPGGSPTAGMPASPAPPPGLHAPSPMRPATVMGVGSNASHQFPSPYATDMGSGIGPHPIPLSMHMGINMGMAFPRAEPVKRKRGRPRKYGPDGSMALALTPHSALAGPVSPSPKRGRGRPPGSGRKQQLAALGTAGVGFTPHVITIAAGEDVATKIMSFSQQGPRAVCILSANGAISNVTLRQPATSGGTVTYEGRFEILSLSGSFLLTENGGTRSRTGGLSVSLAGPDGRVVGGGVAGLLMAASPVQVVVGSFLSNGKKNQPRPANAEGSAALSPGATFGSPNSAVPMVRPSMSDTSGAKSDSPLTTSGNAHQPQGHSMAIPLQSMGWPASQAMSEVRRNTDINISLPGG